MKRCPECKRDYHDDTLLYCLDDGNALLDGPASGKSEPFASAGGQLGDEPQTAILHSTTSPAEAATRAQIHTTEQGAAYHTREAETKGFNKMLLLVPLALAIILFGGFLGYRYFNSTGSGSINSIAVLPFQNVGGNPDAEYLSDGLAESLIYRLSQLPDLKVSPASSVMRYKGKDFDAAKIAGELGVQAVMSGRMTERGESLSISVELIDAVNNRTIWGEQYERKMSDLLSTQREIAATIADKLHVKLSGDGRTGLTKKYTESNEAYQLYLKGRHHWNKRTSEGMRQAAEDYNRAIQKDPAFALAYSALAETHILFSAYGSVPPKEAMPLAKAAALKAIELDPSLAEPYVALGTYYGSYGWDFEKAELQLRKAIELDPNYATAWHWLGNLLPIIGKDDEAVAAGRRAEELDPLSAIISADTGFDLMMVGRFDEAAEQAKRALLIDPNFYYAYYITAFANTFLGKHSEAEAAARRALELNPSPLTRSMLVQVLARSNNKPEAQRILKELTAESEQTYMSKTLLAAAQLAVGNKDSAFAFLEKDMNERGIYLQWLTVNPSFDEIRDEPRYKELLRKIHSLKLD